jgi:hypothetical protein
MKGHPQKTPLVWMEEEKKVNLEKFKKNISNFFDPSFVILDKAFEEPYLNEYLVIVEEDVINKEPFLQKYLRFFRRGWLFSPFS